MSERWVCRRCFAANDEQDAACTACGLERGVDPVPGEQSLALDAVTAGSAGSQPGWRRLLGYWWIPALGIFLISGYFGYARRDANGAIDGGGTLRISDLAVGDCFDVGDSDEVSEVDASPCSEPHQYELFHVARWTAGEAFPADASMSEFVGAECGPAFAAYVGRVGATSTLDVIVFSPTPEGWADGDRVFQCAVYDTADATLTESLRSS